MRVLLDGAVVDDAWVRDGDDAPPGAALLVMPEDLEARRAAGRRCGLLLATAAEVPALTVLAEVPLVGIEFTDSHDGRGFSLARLLRRAGYRGDLRALGAVARDQVFYLARCGFTSFEVAHDADGADLRAGLDDFSLVYQPAADERTPIPRLRSRRA